MGFFNRLFKADPSKDLARAEKLLVRGDAASAMRLIKRAEQQGGSQSVGPLVTRAREALIATALKNAARAEESEYWSDAAEWLEQVLGHVNNAQHEEFTTRIAEFQRLEKQANLPEIPAALGVEDVAVVTELRGPAEHTPDELYEFYVDTLREDVAQRFDNRPKNFRHAVAKLNEGEFEVALELLESLAEASPHDPVLRLERGRARLAYGLFEEATEDLEAAWEELGDEPLDRAGHLSIPALWGEAQLAQENSASLVERLRELADPRGLDLETLKVYAQALLIEESFEEASRFLAAAWNDHPQVSDFPFLLAAALCGQDRHGDAIGILEEVVTPSCGPGGCNVGAPHFPSMIALINLHLESGDPERARELLELLTGMRGGQLGREELMLMARYYDRVGDEDMAREVRERAEHASSAPAAQAPTPTVGGKQAAL